ncbi:MULTISPECIES: enoyl-CoA hydratase [unclassified Arsukibacterium]|uniref:enoyl-CoA hydratase n=1 Tax=unclassified Arsukibacterium TaxID=2635278 RepID=UPI000C8A56C8|nr:MULTISPECIES: enoyl-CoA hydratase [unclassified Arsukibacterium]MAA93237.1 enoyl-CoA hydratase [Rheinheimera sp.]HAW92712.1 enoyl-CoA hydratase [Candidatus Azambacteria bacterium]|tara:strand:+ start:31726 stop:32469 length:744 start_codon:yes stop_codon:yes gene_type:complete
MSVQITQNDAGVLTLSLHRPDKKNALSLAMYRQLTEALQQARNDPGVKVVVLQGSDSCFSSGNDLQDFLTAGELDAHHPTVAFLYQLNAFNKPVVAAVAGLAIGIGTTALLHCDLVYAAPDCRFQMPFSQLGLCPEAASSLLLPQLVGYQRAAQYLLLGEAFTTEQAVAMGLVNQQVANAELLAFAADKAQQLARLPAEAVQQSKALLRGKIKRKADKVIAIELEVFGELLKSDVCRQQLQRFFEKK